MSKLSKLDQRRRRLRLNLSVVERLESRNSTTDISSPLGQAVSAAGLSHLLLRGGMPGRSNLTQPAPTGSWKFTRSAKQAGTASHAEPGVLPLSIARPVQTQAVAAHDGMPGDWLTIARPRSTGTSPGVAGAGTRGPVAASSTTGGSPSAGVRGAITPLQIPSPSPAVLGGISGGLGASALAGIPSSGSSLNTAAPRASTGASVSTAAFSAASPAGPVTAALSGGGPVSVTTPIITTPPSSPSAAFTLFTLDYNHGTVLVPGFAGYATLGGAMDLRAQARGSVTSGYTFSWNTSSLSGWATGITGTSSYHLQFTWTTSAPTAHPLSRSRPRRPAPATRFSRRTPSGCRRVPAAAVAAVR